MIWKLSSLTPYLALVVILDKQNKALREIIKSHRQTEMQASSLFQRAEAPQFIVSSELAILELNASGFCFANDHGMTTPYGQLLPSLFPKRYRELLTDMVQAALRGEVSQEELLLRECEEELQTAGEHLALLLTVEPASWQQHVCAKVLCVDVTSYVTRRLMVVEELKSMHRYAANLEYSIERAGEGLNKQDLWAFHIIMAKLRGAIVLQHHFIGVLKTSMSDFNLQADLWKLLEVSILPAEELDLDVTMTLGKNVPCLCRGDRLKNALLFKALCDFAFEYACTGSEVAIACKLEDRSGQSCKLSFRFAFSSLKLSGPEIKSLFLRPPSQRQLSQLARVISDYGVSLAVHGLVLEAMGGHMLEAYVQDSTSCKILITYVLPLEVAEKLQGEEISAPSSHEVHWNFRETKPHSVSSSVQLLTPSSTHLRSTRNSLLRMTEPILFPESLHEAELGSPEPQSKPGCSPAREVYHSCSGPRKVEDQKTL